MNGSTVANTSISIRLTYAVGKEIALFLYGLLGDIYVPPLVVDNIDNVIVIPRYQSLEERHITDDLISISTPMNFDHVNYLINRDHNFHSARWATLQSPTDSSKRTIEITLPFLTKIVSMFLYSGDTSKSNNSVWELWVLNEYTGLWTVSPQRAHFRIGNRRIVFDFSSFDFPTRKFWIRLSAANLPTGTKLGNISFVTESSKYQI